VKSVFQKNKNNKKMRLLYLLANLTPHELQRFRRFVASPYIIDSDMYSRLMTAIPTPFAVENVNEKKVETDIWQAVFGEKPFEKSRYNRLLSDTTAYLLQFLAMEEARNTLAHDDFYLAKALEKRNLEGFYEKSIATAQYNLQQQPLRDTDFYENDWAQQRLILRHSQGEKLRTERNNLQELHRSLDCFFVLEKLRRICEVLNHESVLQHKYDIKGVDETLAFAKYYTDEATINVYLAVYALLTQKTENEFFTLKNLLEIHQNCFTTIEQRELFTYCLNYCIKQINSSNEAYFQHYLSIFWLILPQKILFLNENLPISDYKNAIAIGLRVGEYERIAQFIQEYSSFLPDEFRSNAISYNLAKLYFAKKEFTKVIDTLNTVQYDNVFYALDSRWTLLKTYYELDEITVLESQIDAFRLYLLRNKTIATSTKKQYKQLLQYLKKIIALQSKSQKERQTFADFLLLQNVVADKKWLIACLG
jgi:hypothetical protein